MDIDPTKTSLSSTNQITAPAGWTIYYYNGTTWSSTAPSTPSGWAAITKVKASGTLNSQGSANGRQVATNTATAVAPPSGTFSAAGTGDGWSVFFDNNNHVFNIFHHDGPTLAIDCHTRTGTSCGAGWPFGVSPYHTNGQSEGWIDNTNHHLWWETNNSTGAGFACVDISNFTTGPTWCGGSASSAFIQAYAQGSSGYDVTRNLAVAGTRLFTWLNNSQYMLCVDTALNNGLGGVCPNQPITFTGSTSTQGIINYNGKVYATAAGSTAKAYCFDPLTFTSCANYPITLPATAYSIFPLPNSSGTIIGMCYVDTSTNPCYNFSGTAITRPSSLTLTVQPYFYLYGKSPETSGTRVYWADGWVGSQVWCWDAALNSGSGGTCANWPIAVNQNYTLQIDPYNTNCIWTNGNDGAIRAFDAILGTQGCTSLPSDVTFDANLIIPRMGCNPTTSITSWRNFTLTGPASGKYNAATLTVTKSDGTAIAGWTAIPITGTRIIDLSTLSVADSGQQPLFKVKFTQRTGTSPADDATATVTAVGDQPELCITPDQHYSCPTTLGPLTSLPSQSAAISASGTATLQGNTQQTFVGASTTTPMTTPSLATCASTITGNASGGGGGAPVAGVVVALLDSAGNPVLDSSNQPVTATTDASGNYSFGTLALGAYKVKFPDKSVTMTVSSASVTSAGSGTANASGGLVTSGAVTLVANTNGIVNAAYALPPSAPSRTQIAASGSNVVFNPFAVAPASMVSGDSITAYPSTGSNFTSTQGSTKLCAANETPNTCTATTVTNANGTYTVNGTNGQVTFTPVAGFVGTATPVTYVVVDAATRKTSAVFTPIIAAPTTAVNDSSWGQTGQVQSISPTANDTVSAGNALVASSIKLCGTGQTSPNCNQTTLTVTGQGTYVVNPTTGVVAFTPVAGYVGDATPIGYQATDLLGSVVTATIQPHVVEPVPVIITPTPTPTPTPTATASPSITPTPSPSPNTSSANAKPDFKSGTQGTPVTVAPLGNDSVAAGTVHICLLGDQSTSCAQNTVSTNDGTWTVHSDSTVTFMPADGFFGKASVGYRAKLKTGKTVWSYITVTIPEKSGLAYTGGGDQQAMFAWMLALLALGVTLLRVAKRRS